VNVIVILYNTGVIYLLIINSLTGKQAWLTKFKQYLLTGEDVSKPTSCFGAVPGAAFA